jgi:hypothetical protein
MCVLVVRLIYVRIKAFIRKMLELPYVYNY